ncbi:hypothetical protein BU24DRAFT_415419 [Aaosphaeria arxii CBS 175.79]|uniref:HNH nuclease domain-containing protein n=1 Tax=Aaosphaeria arxii CBS 175.79 TaxID=1450172 RepID=A0A6A5X8C9_9PLEO|nr:uncharacterized protein BU24DRAFT_415419 [Aaosphaeria arxii CBS 175.79]KAF2009067.1 hypothetical protein BU24DRAFT_415419 [Aaosphaeria arxii CBS 175.79]
MRQKITRDRPPVTLLQTETHRGPVIIRHPGYEDPLNVIFKFNPPDDDVAEGPQRRRGIYGQVVFDACMVVAGNPDTKCWLSGSRNGDFATGAIDVDEVLYDSGKPYGIVPTFREWRFPHQRVPRHWVKAASQSNPSTITLASNNIADALRIRDARCRISGEPDVTDVAHIVPTSEEDWWHRNALHEYNNNEKAEVTQDNVANTMLLRPDLHRAFDASKFIIVPKPSSAEKWEFTIHLMSMSSAYRHRWHNYTLIVPQYYPEPLYARFAWSMFKSLQPFLGSHRRRMLATSTGVRYDTDAEGYATEKACEKFLDRSASESSKTRKTNGGSGKFGGPFPVDDDVELTEDLMANSFSSGTLSTSASVTKTSNGSSTHSASDFIFVDLSLPHRPTVATSSLTKEREPSDPDGQWMKQQREDLEFYKEGEMEAKTFGREDSVFLNSTQSQGVESRHPWRSRDGELV